MAKRKPIDTEPTDALLKFREKRKWQIALRRYVLEKNPCQFYAPYFGLDIENIRLWFQYQFPQGMGWDDFATKWQFDHIIPVTYFDFSKEEDLKLCWSFVNIRVEYFQRNKDRGNRLDVLGAKNYFQELYNTTGNVTALQLLHKIDQIELSEMVSTEGQQQFLKEKAEYLQHIAGYSAFEFEMINRGRSLEDVEKEMNILKKFSN
ncbi:MAG: hypothetical protein EOP53_01820 [Sphingobacteriales bacterium]|nr:MAG: hypothetical protein EOP53_01820 [Sphingobacteriales bacterium]